MLKDSSVTSKSFQILKKLWILTSNRTKKSLKKYISEPYGTRTKSIKVYLNKRGINVAWTETMVDYWPASLDGVFTRRLISSSYMVAFFGRQRWFTEANRNHVSRFCGRKWFHLLAATNCNLVKLLSRGEVLGGVHTMIWIDFTKAGNSIKCSLCTFFHTDNWSGFLFWFLARLHSAIHKELMMGQQDLNSFIKDSSEESVTAGGWWKWTV